MKPLLLLLFALLTSAPQPPAVRVTLSPLTKAAYLAAQKTSVTTHPRTTFPLKKQRGRLVIPTAKGARVFQDIDQAAIERGHSGGEGITTCIYRGYLPDFHAHLVQKKFFYSSEWVWITDTGQELVLWSEPQLSPDGQHVITTSMNLEYGGPPNGLQLLALQDGVLREVWRLEPNDWEPYRTCWLSPTTLLLRKRMWTGQNPGTTYTYARLTLQ